MSKKISQRKTTEPHSVNMARNSSFDVLFQALCSELVLHKKTQLGEAITFAWFHEKTVGGSISFQEIISYFARAKLARPNASRLRTAVAGSREIHRAVPGKDLFDVDRKTAIRLEKQYETVLAAKPAEHPFLVDIGITPYLGAEEIAQAQRMGDLYMLWYCLENSIRQCIEKTLTDHLGSDWWNKASNTELRAKVQQRREKERKQSWIAPRGSSPLFYIDYTDLLALIHKYKVDFEAVIPQEEFAELRFKELEQIRNTVAHSGFLPSEDDFTRVSLIFRDWCRLSSNAKKGGSTQIGTGEALIGKS